MSDFLGRTCDFSSLMVGVRFFVAQNCSRVFDFLYVTYADRAIRISLPDFNFAGLTLPCQFFVPNFGKIVSDFWPSGTRLPPSPAVLPIPISFSCSRPITRPERATRPCVATSVCLRGSAHDGLTGDSRACQRYIQIVVPIPFPIPIPTPVPIPIPIQSSFSQVALCLTEYPRLCLYHKHYPSPFPFPSLYLQCFFRTSISWYKHTTRSPCCFSSFCFLCCFTPEAMPAT